MPEEAPFRVAWAHKAIETLKQRGGHKELAQASES
jgi:hypothetical protein